MSIPQPPSPQLPAAPDPGAPQGFLGRLRRILVGAPLDLRDSRMHQILALSAVLAWIGIGADGLSSSAYGPEEAFKTIGQRTWLAVPLALATAGMVFVLAAAYSKVVEVFQVGGGYAVATRGLGPRLGVVSGAALLVDYILTIAVSITAAIDALFSLAPLSWQAAKLPASLAATAFLLVINLRGVRESIVILAPIFLLFVLSHAILITAGIGLHLGQIPEIARQVQTGISADLAPGGLGLVALVALFLKAFAMSGGTYTGIEAVSNSLPLMREPRVRTAQRTMALLAWSLALCAGGLVFGYLLWGIHPVEGKTMNAVLTEAVAAHLPWGGAFTFITLLSASALLLVAAQAGFIGGPRVMANLAGDSWLPRRFTRLSDRMVTEQGIIVMGVAALLALVLSAVLAARYQLNVITVLVVMYSINVFLTFTLTMAGMCKHWWAERSAATWLRRRRLILFAVAFVLCAGVLVVTVYEKFAEGGWITVITTALVVAACFVVHAHYRRLSMRLHSAFSTILPSEPAPPSPGVGEVVTGPTSPPTLVLLADALNGTGWHTLLNALRTFPGYYQQVVIAGIAVVDAVDSIDALAAEERLKQRLQAWIPQVRALGLPCAVRSAVGTEMDVAAESVCRAIRQDHPRLMVMAGKVLTSYEGLLWRILHNDTALAVQRRLQWSGIPVHLVAARLR